MQFSSGLTGLLSLALHLHKTSEADDIMSRIARRIQANEQSVYLPHVRPVWGRYFLSGWLRDRLGLDEHELREYTRNVRDTTRQRLEEGVLMPANIFKDKIIEEMLAELDSNTMPYRGDPDYDLVVGDGDGGGDAAPDTILRKPATREQIATVEERLGRPLPSDLKDFYLLTNGTLPVVHRYPEFHCFHNRLPPVQSLFWEDDDYMNDYRFELLPTDENPISIDWPGIEGGGIAMYEHDGQGTIYVWYMNEELVAKAKKVLTDAYAAAAEADQRVVDYLVHKYHGGWERLAQLQACWYEQFWGGAGDTIVFHDFKEFLSLVVFQSRAPL